MQIKHAEICILRKKIYTHFNVKTLLGKTYRAVCWNIISLLYNKNNIPTLFDLKKKKKRFLSLNIRGKILLVNDLWDLINSISGSWSFGCWCVWTECTHEEGRELDRLKRCFVYVQGRNVMLPLFDFC